MPDFFKGMLAIAAIFFVLWLASMFADRLALP